MLMAPILSCELSSLGQLDTMKIDVFSFPPRLEHVTSADMGLLYLTFDLW